eukprot:TRINITY_DN10515_c0_g2_i1.p1 TRINITY_DN10515_c0_g2~~TRINITY_DN10515_c0_g2_i1.p1  ORF type:complete len:307 (+),score=131.12 TRINITY_DN10515_c0_g2_i1:59-979(+)
MEDINIDPHKKDDQFYRYKMPALQIKIEGKGNGIKTVLPNMEQIAVRLERDPDYPMKFFGSDLGAAAKHEDDKWIVMGKHEQDRLQASLFMYIERFVLCKACRNPETRTVVDEKKDVWLQCRSCGKETPVDPKEKLLNLIVKKEGKSKKDKKKKKDKSDTPQNPVELLDEVLQSGASEEEACEAVEAMRALHGLSDKDVVRLLGNVVFSDDGFVKKIPKHAGLLRRFVAPSTEKYVFEAVELLMFARPALAARFPIALKSLHDEKVVGKNSVLAWYEGKPHKANKDASAANRQNAKPVIEWLREEA